MDLWSDDPTERLAAARHSDESARWQARLGAGAPMKPWPFGMPTSINPFVVFLGPSPGNSPPSKSAGSSFEPYDLPSIGLGHPGLDVADKRHYWDRVRELGTAIIAAHAPAIRDHEARALMGQLNLGTGLFGKAEDARFEPIYCRWVPEVLLEHLRPAYVILLGLSTRLHQRDHGFDPLNRLGIDWRKPDETLAFHSYSKSNLRFRSWTRQRIDGKNIRFILWPQHPSRAPMTRPEVWRDAAREFLIQSGASARARGEDES